MARIKKACGKVSYSDNSITVVENRPFTGPVWRAVQELSLFGSFLCFSDNLKVTFKQLEFNSDLPLDF